MEHEFPQPFAQQYGTLLKRMALRGLSPKTVELYSHGVRRATGYFGFEMDNLSREQLTEYLSWLLAKWSWSIQKTEFNRALQINALMDTFPVSWGKVL